jgi:predicted RNA-binding Zn-ribbon protein involved in translation (DUF1610 family)
MSTSTKKSKYYRCAACGGLYLRRPQRNESGGASHEICPACGFESGYTDDEQEETYETWREKWVSQGMLWYSKGRKAPKTWNPVKALHALSRPQKAGRKREDQR